MGLIRFNKKATRVLSPELRRKITFFSSVGLGCLVALTFTWQELRRGGDVDSLARRLNSTAAVTVEVDSVSLYPPDLLLNEPYFEEPTGKKFLALLHVVGMVYMLLGLNTVCDCYFAGSIDNLCDAWEMTPDVAGATFMAAGGSAPELFTSLIGATIAKNDVGFGTIVGSAVFNVLFVIGLCGYVAKGNIDLTWWPLFRDCTYYIISLGVLAVFTYNQYIVVYEAVILFLMYLGYVSIMFVNQRMNLLAYQMTGTPLSKELQEYADSRHKSSAKVEPETMGVADDGKPPEPMKDNLVTPDKLLKSSIDDEKTDAGTGPSANEQGDQVIEISKEDDKTDDEKADGEKDKKEGKEGEGDDDDEDDDDGPDDFMEKPEGTLNMIMWVISLPVYVPLYLTMPWPSKGSKLWPLCFSLSLVWIAGFSFLLVWWTETVGAVIGVPTIIMGLTVLAAGTSIPDAVSSMAVARKGQADMAVSSSIGSNIFDILVGLPVPWMIQSAIKAGDPTFEGVFIKSPYLMFYVLLLLFVVFMVIVSIKLTGWKLTKGLGACMAVLYFIFIICAIVVDVTQPTALMTNPPTE
eukprot:gb/GFBE01029623.1/.p1 GENE.gb/GFBE01029623.1/~~gb/GFBE01029623.1/.p1  ORF type:complete len:577 (+),score=136.24 gb/GFBE01029623.1/:1-1731(+)